jgi:Ras-related protein Rab-7A
MGGCTSKKIEQPQPQPPGNENLLASRQKIGLLKVVLIGDSSVGKTSLLKQYTAKQFTPLYKATIGADFCTKEILIDNRPVTLRIWDTAGQERFSSLGATFYRGADACILVYDVNNEHTFQRLDYWKTQFIEMSGMSQINTKFPLILVGNKIDTESTRKVSKQEAEEWCHKNGIRSYYECSAKEDVDVDKMFQAVALMALQMHEGM